MSKQNNALFINILKNSGPDFKFREELIQLHSRSLQLESTINLRKEIEFQYNNLKLEEVKERIDEMKFQNKLFLKRNNDILNDLQKNKLKNLENASEKKEIYLNIEMQKKKFGDYIDSIIPKIQTEFNVELHKESNQLAMDMIKELKRLEKNKNLNNYYDQLTKANEKLAEQIEFLKKKNHEAVENNKEKEKAYLESQKNLKNQIDNFKIEEKKDNFDINEYYRPNPNDDNKNTNPSKQLPELNNLNINLKKDSLSSETSLQDLRKQIINPQKGIPEGTIYQNFDKPNPNNTINNIINPNNIKKNEGDITPNENINNNINNNNKININNNQPYEGSNFNLLNSQQNNGKNVNNLNDNNNNKNSINNMVPNTNKNIINDVNFVNMNNISNNAKNENNNNINQNEKKDIKESKKSDSKEFESFEEVEV